MNSSSKNVLLVTIAVAAAIVTGIGFYWAASHRPVEQDAPRVAATPRAVAEEKPATPPRASASTGQPLIRIFGIVNDSATGAAIENAEIRVYRNRRNRDEEPPPPVEAATDENGVYEVRVPPNTFDAIYCLAAGYTRQQTQLGENAPVEIRMDFQLVRGGTVTGHITDKQTGDPITGIGVELVGAQENAFERMRSRQYGPNLAARSQNDGSYSIDGVPAGSYRGILNMRNSGYLYKPEDAVAIEIEAGKTYDNINFAVERGAEITGHVRNAATGEPVVNANVVAMPAQMIQRTMRRMSTGQLNNLAPTDTRTGDQGEFTLAGLDFGTEYYAVANADGLATGSSDVIQLDRTKVPPRIEIALTRGSTLTGIAHYPDGTPAAGSQLLLFPDAGAGWTMFMGPRDVRTADDGTFTIDNVAAGAYWLRPEGDFSGGLVGRVTRPQSKAAKVEADGVTDVSGIEVVVAKDVSKSADEPAQGSIKGTVLDKDGSPAADVRVEGRQVGNIGRSYGSTTGADGTFELAELRGPMFDLSVSSELGIAKQPSVPVGANVTLRLTPPASLSGHVVDGAGDPVPGCSVQLTNLDEAGKVSSFISVMQGILGARPSGQRTDTNGAFEFTKLAPGSYVVKAQSASHGTAETHPMSVTAGEDVTGVQIALNPGVTINGTVFGPNGERIRGATVQLGPVTQDAAANLVSAFVPSGVLKTAGTTTTNDKGEFTLNQVAPGAYRLVAAHSDYAKSVESGFTVSPGQDITGYRIVLGKGGEARGTLAIDGKPQAGAMIVMLGETGVEVVQTDSQGRFDVRGLTSGPHMIAAFDPSRLASNGVGIQFTPQVVDVADSQTTDISLGGSGGVKVTGTIGGGNLGTLTLVALRKPDGTALSDLDLADFSNLLESMRSLGTQTVVGPDGSFAMENVPPGNYTLEVYSMNFDESNPDINALLNLPRNPAYSKPVAIGPNQPPIQIDISTP